MQRVVGHVKLLMQLSVSDVKLVVHFQLLFLAVSSCGQSEEAASTGISHVKLQVH